MVKELDDLPLAGLKNLGPKSVQWLGEIQVKTLAQLDELGSVAVYKKLKALGYPVTLNLVWAIEAALRGIDWRELPETDKEHLRREINSH